jgi:hypothetical protein
MADQATAHALDGTHRVIRCPLNLDHVQNVDLSITDEGGLVGQSNVMKYTCKKLEPPKDDPHARWAVGVYDKTTGRVDFKYADEFDMYADPLQAKATDSGSALPEGDWLERKIAVADAFQTPKAQRQLRQRAANRVAPEATFGGADLAGTVRELEEKASQQQAEEEKSGLEVVSTQFDSAFAAHGSSLDAQKRALKALASERGRDSWVPEAWPVFIVSLLKDADEAKTRDLLLARHLLEFRSLDQKGTCRVVAVARERQMPEAVLGAILETYAQASKTAAGSYRYDCRAAPLQDALTVAVLFALLRAGGGRLRVEDAARALRATVKRCTALLKARLGCAVSAKRKRGQPHETTARLPGVEEEEEAAAEGD